jgi:hypothetical protein
MKQTINQYEFRNAFQNMRPDNFSYEGLEILFNGLEQYEVDTGEEVELDVIAICCDFSEMGEAEVRASYNIDESESVEEFLQDNTWLLGSHNPVGKTYFIFKQF